MIPWITYSDAITEALRVEMRRDPALVCLTAPNGEAGPTDDLASEFGTSRVRQHDGGASILAAAAAAASEGLRPVCELALTGSDQPSAETLRDAAGSGALVVRLIGRGRAVWPWNEPGADVGPLKVVSPATAADAKGLMVSALRDPGPVCFLESPDLYTAICDGVPEGDHRVAFGDARLIKRGTEVIVFAHGAAAVAAERASQSLNGEIGIVDVRSLSPLDRDAIAATVRETGKVLIVTEPWAPDSFASELVRLIYEELPQYLDAPIRELSSAGADVANGWVDEVREACVELVAF